MEAFSFTYEGYQPDQEGLREVLISSGNGRFCSRGAAEWEDAGGVHYPGTYAHRVYNRETTILGGVPVLNEDLVDLPNWLVLKLRIEGEDAIRLGDVELLDYRHELDLRRAVTTRSVCLRDADGRETRLCSRRFVSMAHPQSAAIEWTLVASTWSGRVEIVSAIDGRVTNRGVARYLELEGRHLDPVSPRTFGPDVIALKVQTRQSNVYISQAARTRLFAGQQPVAVERTLYQTEDYIQQVLAFELRERAPQEAGLEGAMFPWQSGSEGTEETQRVHLNPLSGRWEPDLSRNQRHVSAAIFYNVWRYFQATEDLPFLRDYGAEMMLEIARFWGSIAHFNPGRGRYEIHGVMGPDEFHEKYPGAAEGGLRNNAYTNVMVAWLCGLACEVLSLLPGSRADALRARLEISAEELHLWEDMSRRMFVPFHDDGIISQFEGYDELEELDWDRYRERYGNIQRLDRILRAEGDDPDRYKISKQADAVMLFYLFSPSALRGCSSVWATSAAMTRPRGTSATTTSAPPMARRSASSRSLGSSRRWTRRAPGSGFWWRCAAMPRTSRAARPAKESTWGSWREPLT